MPTALDLVSTNWPFFDLKADRRQRQRFTSVDGPRATGIALIQNFESRLQGDILAVGGRDHPLEQGLRFTLHLMSRM
jgi:hypothetical protein